MRRPARVIAVLLVLVGALAFAGSAGAAPTVHLRAEPVPIPGFPHTGYILGHGAALKAEYRIEGHEYFGFPPPLIGVTFFLPKGTLLHPSGFPTCPKATLEPAGSGPPGCPKGSSAGPLGHALGVVAFGKELVPEETTIEPFYAPGGGLLFFTSGHSPVSLEILSSGSYVSAASEGFGQKLVSQIPLVETVPGAPDASVQRISVEAGSALMKGGRPVYYGTLPKSCPKEGFTVRSDLTFAGLAGLPQQTVTVTYKAPCPRR
ncbi:MAG TPA: hypothetical protein VFW29_05080 [Solirubrobacteraceae bacterium]|nr:hypothetical protein [Solirubrobacteraceae bacterium]